MHCNLPIILNGVRVYPQTFLWSDVDELGFEYATTLLVLLII